jgi:hypothetical protein
VSSPVQTSIWNKLIRYSDCVMPINRATHTASDSTSDDGTADATGNNAAAGKKDLGPSTVTLSGLLNAIDGVSSQVSGFLVTSSWADLSRKTLYFSLQPITPKSWTKLFADQVDSTSISPLTTQ